MDHFAVFGQEPRAWIDPERLKEKFLALSAEMHPDKFAEPAAKKEAEQRFASLNHSYEILRHSRTRLQHLLELHGQPAANRVQDVPEAALEFFTLVAEQTRKADELLKQKSSASSPMLKVQFFERALEATEQIQELQNRLAAKIREVESAIRGSEEDLAGLQRAAALLGFLERWNAQLQQRLAALAF